MKLLSITTASLLALLSSGCSLGKLELTGEDPINVPAATSTSGVVMGGQQPIAGMTLQLYVASITGYGTASSTLGASFTTTPAGNFTFPSYTCPTTTSTSQVYMIGTGGTPLNGSANTNAALMVGLGQCSSVAGLSFIDMNEVTTVATIYALSPFMVDATHVGTSATNVLGLQNAFATINKLANIGTGQTAVYSTSYTAIPANATIPTAEINTLADILEACINSAGGVASDSTDGTNGTACGNLFYLTNIGTTPTNTVTAMLHIAQHPYYSATGNTNYVYNLLQLRLNSPAFQPAISKNSPPTDWTITVAYSSANLLGPAGIAADQSGNIWITNSAATGAGGSVTELASTGAETQTVTASNKLNYPTGIAIDASGNVFVANSGSDNVIALGTGSGSTAISTGAGSAPSAIAIDGVGNLFIANGGSSTTNTYSIYTNTGTAIGTYSPASSNTPVGIAISLK